MRLDLFSHSKNEENCDHPFLLEVKDAPQASGRPGGGDRKEFYSPEGFAS
jgi:hypothetical protein